MTRAAAHPRAGLDRYASFRHADRMVLRRLAPITLLLAVSLAACTPGGLSPTPTGGASEMSPSPTADAEPKVDRVLLRPDGVDVLGADDVVLASADILEVREGILEVFEFAFSAAPEISPYEGGLETQPGTRYDWGGLEVRIGEQQLDEFEPDLAVEWTVDEIDGIEIETWAGASIGTSRADLQLTGIQTGLGGGRFFDDIEGVVVGTAGEAGFLVGNGGPEEELVWSIRAIGDASGVTRFVLPAKNYGV